MKLIDPFYFTLLRYMAVSLILVLLLIVCEGTKALGFEGRAKWVSFYGTMAFSVYNCLVFLGQKTAGSSGAMLASIMMALMSRWGRPFQLQAVTSKRLPFQRATRRAVARITSACHTRLRPGSNSLGGVHDDSLAARR